MKIVTEGLEKKDKLKVIGGTSAILAGVASGSDFILNSVEGHNLFGATGKSIAGVAETAATIFGITHGTIDVGLLAKQCKVNSHGYDPMGLPSEGCFGVPTDPHRGNAAGCPLVDVERPYLKPPEWKW